MHARAAPLLSIQLALPLRGGRSADAVAIRLPLAPSMCRGNAHRTVPHVPLRGIAHLRGASFAASAIVLATGTGCASPPAEARDRSSPDRSCDTLADTVIRQTTPADERNQMEAMTKTQATQGQGQMDLIELARESGMAVTLDARIGQQEYVSVSGSLAALARFADAVRKEPGSDESGNGNG